MKVVHVSTSAFGGAGIAARRLHEGLLEQGVDSNFLTLDKADIGINFHTIERYRPSRLENFLHNRLKFNFKQEHRNQAKIALGGDWEIFSFPSSEINILDHQLIQSADIIHLHWIAGLIDYQSFFSKIDKPIVWTLHDMNPFQGGFHYQGDKIRNSSNRFGALDERLCKQKKYALSFQRNIKIVCPSNWLMNESLASENLGRFSHCVIPNGVDTDVYSIYDKSLARSIFKLPSKKRLILFVSENIENKRKGFDLVNEAIEKIDLPDDVLFCSVGYRSTANLNPKVIHLGRILDNRLMPLLYNAVDAVIIPSREDNLPNVMIESLVSGTPVIGFSIGGIGETINDGLTGFLADSISAIKLGDAINRFLDNSILFDRISIRSVAREKFNLERQARDYISLYTKIFLSSNFFISDQA